MTIETNVLFILLATVTPPEPPPVPSVAEVSARMEHRLALRADLGWNGLAGFGLRGSWEATPRLAVDSGAGYVLAGPKAGARVRWNFMTADLSPYVAVGAIVSAGRRGPQTITGDDGDAFTFHVGPAAFAQAVAGLDFQGRDRISYSFELGWAQALNGRDLHVISGSPSANDWREVRFAAAGGPVIGGAVGYAF